MPVSFDQIEIEREYSRHELAHLWSYAGIEALSRGVVTPKQDNKIILFVTQQKHPDAEQYEDELVESVLLWEGPNDHFAEERILAHQDSGDEIHLFYRRQARNDFSYKGLLNLYCCQRFTDRPSRFVFRVHRSKSGSDA